MSPLIPGFSPDPSICRSADDYFLVTSSFEYFPGVPLFHSRDLMEWRQIGYVLDRPSQLDLRGVYISGGIYAPTIREHNGRFYMITTKCGGPKPAGNFVVSTDDPFGEWSEPVWLPEMAGIDPDLFWDVDGTCYAQWSWRRRGVDGPEISIGQAAIDLVAGRLLEEPRLLWTGTGGLGPEGPHLYRIDGRYFLCIAEGGTEYGHMQTIARSDSVHGPWESCPRNPVLTHRSTGSEVHAVGHADLVQAPDGRWFGVAHGIRPRGYHKFHVLGRETFLFPVSWDEAGWPILGEAGQLPTTSPAKSLPAGFVDDGARPDFPLDWNWLREREPEAYRRESGQMVIDSGATREGKVWIGVRQRMHVGMTRALLRPELPMDRGSEAETTLQVFQNEKHHAAIGVRRAADGPQLFTRIRLGRIVVDKPGPTVLASEPVELWIESANLEYKLGYRLESGEAGELETCEARFLSTEVSGRFTGVYFALVAKGGAAAAVMRFSAVPKEEQA